MELRLRLILATVIFLFLSVIINFIRKDDISLKYSLIWLFSGIVMIIATMIPNFLAGMSHFLGFELVSNMIFMIAIIILLMICFSFTIIVSRQTQKIKLLVQELSLLKSKVEDLEKEKK